MKKPWLALLLPLLLLGCQPRSVRQVTDPVADTPPSPPARPDHDAGLASNDMNMTGADATRPDQDTPQSAPSAEQEQDFWTLWRKDTVLPDCSQVPGADRWARWYASKKDYMQRVQQRARPLLWHIHQHIRQHDLPSEFALLPVVESAYNPWAYSHGRAAGLWQFIPALAKEYGLKQNWWYDGRRDIIAATDAAADHLQALGQRFNRDWLLVLAAYNSGHNRVARQLKRLQRQGMSQPDYRALRLPRETRTYIPKMVGLSCLFKHPQRYGFTPVDVPMEPLIQTVDTRGQIDLALAAELAGIDLDTLYRFNPAWNRWATDPDGPHRLLLPRKAAERFRQALTTLDPDQRVTWQRIRIRPGDTLIGLARKHHVTPQLLRDVNQLHNHLIRAGDHLLVPKAQGKPGDYVHSQTQRLARLQRAVGTPGTVHHRVRAGESFWSIARHYGVSVRALAGWNGMAPGDLLRVGQTLVIRKPARNASSATHGGPPGHQTRRQIVYTVRPGESLWSISRKFAVDVAAIRRWNGLTRDLLKPGQKLRLHVDVTRQAG